MKSLVFAGGGTGGHLYPALALADAVALQAPGIAIHFVGTPERIEARRVPEAGYPFHPIAMVGLPRKLGLPLLRFPGTLLAAVSQARQLLCELAPGLLVGTGGYVSVPALMAAHRESIPYVIQEQNANPGLANRWLARKAAEVFTAYEEAARKLPARQVHCFGNPVRPEIHRLTVVEARSRLGFPPTPHLLLVTGGSLGARNLNRAFLTVLPHVLARPDWSVLHVAGPAEFEQVREATREMQGDRYRLVPYLEDMPAGLAGCDLAVSRAGAITLSELTSCGKPMVLVPYAHGGGDQPVNAAALARAGAASALPDDASLPETLARTLAPLLDDAEQRERMARASRSVGRPEALDRIVDRLLAYF